MTFHPPVLFGSSRPRRIRRLVATALVAACATAVVACGDDSASSGDGSRSGSGEKPKVALILKTFSNPFFVSMQKSAEEAADRLGVELKVSAGQTGADTGPQITAIENAIAGGYDGILIVLNGDAVNAALEKARSAGLYTIALDTPPSPPETVDITYATDNREAGRLIGDWAAAKLGGEDATIALLDAINTDVVSVDIQRNHGFLDGMGIPVGNENLNGKAPKTGQYTGGDGGGYEIACELPSMGSIEGGKSAMQTCLQKNPGINVVYAVNEPAAQGAAQALKAAGNDALVVAIDGGCENLRFLRDGSVDATAAQFPGKMAAEGVRAIHGLVTEDVRPSDTPGLDFHNTGVQLFTDDPQTGVDSVDSAAAQKLCWG